MRVPKTHWLRGAEVACKKDPDACNLIDGDAWAVMAHLKEWPGTVCGTCLRYAKRDPDEKTPAPRTEWPGPQSKE